MVDHNLEVLPDNRAEEVHVVVIGVAVAPKAVEVTLAAVEIVLDVLDAATLVGIRGDVVTPAAHKVAALHEGTRVTLLAVLLSVPDALLATHLNARAQVVRLGLREELVASRDHLEVLVNAVTADPALLVGLAAGTKAKEVAGGSAAETARVAGRRGELPNL